jgi:hypothetical protein
MERNTVDLLACARLLDARLHETLDDPFRLPRGRLYGCTAVPGDDEPVRACFLGDHRDVYELIAGPVGSMARQFDAAVVAITGWGAPLDEVGTGGVSRPSLHPQRHRIRACCAVGDDGVVSVVRTEREPDSPIELLERGFGVMPDALLAMWEGTPLGPVSRPSAARSTGPAARHRRPA